MLSGARDIKSELHGVHALAATVEAGAEPEESGVAVDGAAIDTQALPTRFNTVAVMASVSSATLGEGETLTLDLAIQTGPDGSNWSTVAEADAALVLAGGSGGSTETGVGRIGLDMAFADRYLRVVATPTLSAAASDEAAYAAIAVFAGAERMPV